MFQVYFNLIHPYLMVKDNINHKNIITPKIALKIGPNQKKNNSIESFTRTDVNNIYGLNRFASKDSLENGILYHSEMNLRELIK